MTFPDIYGKVYAFGRERGWRFPWNIRPFNTEYHALAHLRPLPDYSERRTDRKVRKSPIAHKILGRAHTISRALIFPIIKQTTDQLPIEF